MRRIPDGRRTGELFPDAPAVLAWILQRLYDRRRSPIRLSIEQTETDRVLALFMLLRAASSHAKVVLAAARGSVAEAGEANVRAMLELWADFNYLRSDQTGEAQRRMFVAGALVLLRREPSPEAEQELASRFPNVFVDVKQRMAKNPFAHWSGNGRKAMVTKYCGTEYGDLYELLSWDVHPVLPGVLDLNVVNADTGEYRLQHRLPQHEVARDNCITAAHIVRKMWNDLAADYPDAEKVTRSS